MVIAIHLWIVSGLLGSRYQETRKNPEKPEYFFNNLLMVSCVIFPLPNFLSAAEKENGGAGKGDIGGPGGVPPPNSELCNISLSQFLISSRKGERWSGKR
jgi:hypothetical protein